MVNTDNLTISTIDDIKGYDNAGDLIFVIDELQDCTISNTQEKSDVTGKGGRKLSSLKKNKAVTISGNNGLFSGDLTAAQTGSDVQQDVTTLVDWVEIVPVSKNKAVTEFKAVGVLGNELKIYLKNDNGSKGKALTQVASDPTSEQFTYAPDTKQIVFAEGAITDGKEVIVCYDRKIKAAIVSNMSDSYSKTLRLVINATAQDTCDAMYHIQFQIPRADFSGNFDFAMGSDQTVQSFEAESLTASGACGASQSQSGKLWDMIIFDDGVEDVV